MEVSELDARDARCTRALPERTARDAGDPYFVPERIHPQSGHERVSPRAGPEPRDDVQHLYARSDRRLRREIVRRRDRLWWVRPREIHAATSMCARSHSTIAAKPSTSEVDGAYPNAARAIDVSAAV